MMNARWLRAVAGLAATAALAATAFAGTPPGTVTVTTVTPVQTAPLRDLQYLNMPPILRHIIGAQHLSQRQIHQLYDELVREGYLTPPPLSILNKKIKPAMEQAPSVRDLAVQSKLYGPRPNSITPGVSFPGIGVSGGDSPGCHPPDTDMAVGNDYVVEIVNLCDGAGVGAFEVWDKDGNVVQSTTSLAGLWMAGSGCDQGAGDNVVLYDQLADRWIMEQFNNGYTGICVAVSQTSDPTGSYYLYNVVIDRVGFTDYPKLGIWPDAYYVATNDFVSDFHVNFTAMNRTQMLAGQQARIVVINGEGENEGGLDYSVLPASLDGTTPPPEGDPGIFVNFVSPYLFGGGTPYSLNMWRMRVDWGDPQNSSLSGPSVIEVDPFNDGICCIPQPSPGNSVDSLGDRLMYRLAYRNFGDHQAMVVDHTVGTGSPPSSPPAGIRWYELDAPAGATSASAFTVAQQGTYLPDDGNSRWMASLAMDHVGNIGLGYSMSSSNRYPSAVFTGQNVGAPSGVMDAGETVFMPGRGSQTGSSRWGDYSTVEIDPTDDCTFWTSQEYMSAPGSQWSTAVGAFKFDNCASSGLGTVEGTVTDAATGDPIPFGTVMFVPGNEEVQIDQSGQYVITLPAGEYTGTVWLAPYAPKSAQVTVIAGGTTEQDFALVAGTTVTVSGTVSDGGHGYPLYAEVEATSGAAMIADVWTTPRAGAYRLHLSAVAHYTVTVTPYFHGYTPKKASGTIRRDMSKSFVLSPDASCTAPGYQMSGGVCQAIPGGVVEGMVYQRSPRTPLNGATVSDENGNGTTTATVNGHRGVFALFEPTGGHTLTASKSGYQDAVRNLQVANGKIVVALFGLNVD